jgi:hypothetical protein
LRRDAPIEEIEVDISSSDEEEQVTEEPDVEGGAEVEEVDTNKGDEDKEGKDEL